jgi:hypothetical protein
MRFRSCERLGSPTGCAVAPHQEFQRSMLDVQHSARFALRHTTLYTARQRRLRMRMRCKGPVESIGIITITKLS